MEAGLVVAKRNQILSIILLYYFNSNLYSSIFYHSFLSLNKVWSNINLLFHYIRRISLNNYGYLHNIRKKRFNALEDLHNIRRLKNISLEYLHNLRRRKDISFGHLHNVRRKSDNSFGYTHNIRKKYGNDRLYLQKVDLLCDFVIMEWNTIATDHIKIHLFNTINL